MNKVILIGRLTRDPEIRYSNGDNMAIARYTLAVDRRFKRDSEQTADFIPCVAFGRSAEFAEKFLQQGKKIAITGRIQTGSYTNREGAKVYSTEVIVEEQEFVESKNAEGGSSSWQGGANSRQGGYAQQDSYSQQGGGYSQPNPMGEAPSEPDLDDGFMNIPDSIDEKLPFQ